MHKQLQMLFLYVCLWVWVCLCMFGRKHMYPTVHLYVSVRAYVFPVFIFICRSGVGMLRYFFAIRTKPTSNVILYSTIEKASHVRFLLKFEGELSMYIRYLFRNSQLISAYSMYVCVFWSCAFDFNYQWPTLENLQHPITNCNQLEI